MKNLFWMVALATIFFVAQGCKEDNRIGLDLIKDDLIESSFETFTNIETIPISGDSTVSTNTGYGYVGRYDDPVFGTTTAGFTMQFYMQGAIPTDEVEYEAADGSGTVTSNLPFGPHPAVDSVVLFLAYDTTYTLQSTLGNKDVDQYLSLYTQSVGDSVESGSSLQTNPIGLIEEKVVDIRHRFQSDDLTQYRIRLDNDDFLARFLPNDGDALSMENAYKSNIEFQRQILNGLIMMNDYSQADNQSISLFYVFSDRTRLRMYYRNDSVAADSTPYYDFKPINNLGSIQQNSYIFSEHYYENAEFSSILDDLENTNTSQKIYVQSLGGVRTLVRFPGLENWKLNEDISIRKAHLVIRPVHDEGFVHGGRLAILKLMDNDSTAYLPEYYGLSNNSYTSYSESYDEVDDVFIFDVTSYVNEVRNGEADDVEGLVLRHVNAISSLNSDLLYSANATDNDYKMSLRITYSKEK